MRILSKFSDYYDGVAKQGIDKSLIYSRLTEEFWVTNDHKGRATYQEGAEYFIGKDRIPVIPGTVLKSTHFSLSLSCNQGVILFCGKAYPFYKVRASFPFLTSKDTPRSSIHFTEASAIEANKALLKFMEDRNSSGSQYHIGHMKRDNFSAFNSFRTERPNLPRVSCSSDSILNLHRHFTSPVICIEGFQPYHSYDKGVTITVDPRLSDLSFQKVMDAYTTFQEISMFLGGVLGNPEKEVTGITDKDRIQQHGFDKWSFRKLPEVKK